MTQSNSKVAVVVITYNGKHHLKECFESLKYQTFHNFELFLIDNYSKDGSSEYTNKFFPYVNIIRLKKNYGFAGGYNKAIKKVKSEYIAFLNDDTKVDPKWLEELVQVIEKDKKIFAVGSKLLFYNYPDTINHAGAMITPIGAGIDIGFGQKDSSNFNEQKYVGAVCGGGMLTRKKIFQQLGGFDEDYFAYFEDLDICWRAWLLGYKTIYVPNSIVYHKYGGSWGNRISNDRIYHCQRNRLYNMFKNFEIFNLIKGFCISLCFDIYRIFFLTFKRNYRGIFAIIKANFDFIKNINSTYKKRKYIQKNRKINDRKLYQNNLILSFYQSIQEFKKIEGLT